MTEDDQSRVDPRALAPSEQYAEALVYDFAKFMTTLALLALGGVLSMSQGDALEGVKPFKLTIIIGSISIGGIAALSVPVSIATSRLKGKEPTRWLGWNLAIAVGSISLGLGAFLQMFIDAIR
jgi:hypothetical protein